ncbi:hypothetical protein [Metamycoplasma equirhinis]
MAVAIIGTLLIISLVVVIGSIHLLKKRKLTVENLKQKNLLLLAKLQE